MNFASFADSHLDLKLNTLASFPPISTDILQQYKLKHRRQYVKTDDKN